MCWVLWVMDTYRSSFLYNIILYFPLSISLESQPIMLTNSSKPEWINMEEHRGKPYQHARAGGGVSSRQTWLLYQPKTCAGLLSSREILLKEFKISLFTRTIIIHICSLEYCIIALKILWIERQLIAEQPVSYSISRECAINPIHSRSGLFKGNRTV